MLPLCPLRFTTYGCDAHGAISLSERQLFDSDSSDFSRHSDRRRFIIFGASPAPSAMEAVIHALRAENAALRAEVSTLRANPGDFVDTAHRPATDDAAMDLPANLRTWTSVGAGSTLSGAELERYARHISLPAFGAAKQAMLANARVLLVGCGGLGSPAALYLAAAGVGRLDLCDADHVERSNLHRQVIHADARVGAPKVMSAATSIAQLNPGCKVTTHLQGVSPANAVQLVKDVDVVLDCTDNSPTRYLLSDACAVVGRPLVSAAAVGTEGQLTVFVNDTCGGDDFLSNNRRDNHGSTSSKNKSNPLPCYRCIFPTPPSAGDRPNCASGGVLGPVPGVLGVLQALEAVKVITNVGERFGGRLLMFDALSSTRNFSQIQLRKRDTNCCVCGDRPTISASDIATYDYDAFVGGVTACEAKRTGRDDSRTTREKSTDENEKINNPPKATQLPAALDDAAAARIRNVSAARGDRDAPWVTSSASGDAGRGTTGGNTRSFSATENENETDVPILDTKAKPPLHARAEAPGRVSPVFLLHAIRSRGDAVVVVDVRPKHLSDAAKLRNAVAIPLKELDARMGEVWRAVDSVNAAATACGAAAAKDRRVIQTLDATVYAICAKGNASQLACAYLQKSGLPVAGDVLGGYERWREDVDPSFPKL